MHSASSPLCCPVYRAIITILHSYISLLLIKMGMKTSFQANEAGLLSNLLSSNKCLRPLPVPLLGPNQLALPCCTCNSIQLIARIQSHQIQFNCFTSAPLTCKWHESCIRPPQSPAKLSLLIILNSERRLLAYFEAVDAGEDRASPAFLSVMFFHLRGRWHNVKRTLFTQMAQGYGSVTWGFFTCSPQALHVKYTMLWK